jgi:hypothetical protein
VVALVMEQLLPRAALVVFMAAAVEVAHHPLFQPAVLVLPVLLSLPTLQ